MTFKSILFLFVAFTIGFATSPAYAGDMISCNGFESCPVADPSISALEARMDALEAENAGLKALLAGVSRLIDPNTSMDTLRFSNMNVQVVSGSGTTDGATNGTGNLIIGYNEWRDFDEDNRGGSHMLVVGSYNNYTSKSFGGMVVGRWNETSAPFASISGGRFNIASGLVSSISGGQSNKTSGLSSSVSGGENNFASQEASSISGGINNRASGAWASVSGGDSKTAAAARCTVGDNRVDC